MEHQEIEGGLEVLEADLAETENSVYHLVRSNVEIAQFLEEAPGDEDLEQALQENKLVLVKKRHRIKALKNAISDLKAQRPHLAVAASKPPPSGSGTEHGDTISAMTASMSLDVPAALSPAGNSARDGSEPAGATTAAPGATMPVRKGQHDEADGVAKEAEGGDFGGDSSRGGVLL